MSRDCEHSLISSIWYEIQEISRMCVSVSSSLVGLAANCAAHCCAKKALTDVDFSCSGSAPNCLVVLLLKIAILLHLSGTSYIVALKKIQYPGLITI